MKIGFISVPICLLIIIIFSFRKDIVIPQIVDGEEQRKVKYIGLIQLRFLSINNNCQPKLYNIMQDVNN